MNRTFKRAAAVLLALACAAGAAASAAAAAPEVDASKAVIDNAGILSAETEDIVTNLSSALSDTCGAQIGVYTVDQVGNTTMEAYAYDVFSAWGLGDDDRDNGVLLLLAPVDDDYWAMQGSGLETRLPSSTLSDLLYEYLEPSWVQQDYDTGTQAMVRALAEELCNIYGVSMDIDAVGPRGLYTGGGAPGGMVRAAHLGTALGLTPAHLAPDIAQLVEAFGLPTAIPCSQADYAAAIGLDKKGAGSSLSLILLDRPGHALAYPILKQQLLEML